MTTLDHKYISSLVRQAQAGDSNAFAELYAATFQKEYAFACYYLKEKFMAQQALEKAYIYAMRQISKLRDPSLFLPWLNHAILESCFNVLEENGNRKPYSESILVDKQNFTVRQVLQLPLSQSQSILLRYHCGMRTGQIADLMEVSRGIVRRSLSEGKDRLRNGGTL